MNKENKLTNEKTQIDFIKNKLISNEEYNNYLNELYEKYFYENKNIKIKIDENFINNCKNISNNFTINETQRYLTFLLSNDYNIDNLSLSDIKFLKDSKSNMCIYDVRSNYILSFNNSTFEHDKTYISNKGINRKTTVEELIFRPESKKEISKFLNFIFRGNKSIKCNLQVERSINSCGIILFEGLNTLFSQYRTNNELKYRFNITIGTYDIILKISSINLYIYFLNNFIRLFCFRKYSNSSIIIFSTNISSNSLRIVDIRNLLIELKKNSLINEIITYNKNSGNEIITCTLDYYKFCKNNDIIQI